MNQFINILIIFLNLFYAKSIVNKTLKFNNNGEFTILQFTDLHYGEPYPEQDPLTMLQQDYFIKLVQPDLVVLTGDMVTGYNWDGKDEYFYQNCWKNFTKSFLDNQVKYCYTLGNHDAQGNLNRTQIIELDMTHPYSLTQRSFNITGISNYWVKIDSSFDNKTSPSSILWFFDTNQDTCQGNNNSWGCIEMDQIEWYIEQSQLLNNQYQNNSLGLAFMHIPIPEYNNLYNEQPTYNRKTQEIDCPTVNTNFFSALLEQNNIQAMFCGHDHNNDFGGIYQGVELVYGRKTGYGGYGPPADMLRGARVIKLKEYKDKPTTFIHYIVQQDGSVQYNTPSQIHQDKQVSCPPHNGNTQKI